MPTELYFKEGYGRRLRRIDTNETHGLQRLYGPLYSSLDEPMESIAISPPGNLPLEGDGVLYAQWGIYFGGRPLNSQKNATIAWETDIDSGSFVVVLPDGSTAENAASIIAASNQWPPELDALAVSTNVRLTPDIDITLVSMTIAI